MAVVLGVGILASAYASGWLDFLNPNSFTTYTSARSGYTVSYPRSWTLDDSQAKARLDVIHNANKNGVVLIQVFEHESYKTEEGRAKAVADMRKDFEGRSEYKLDYFNDEVVDGQTYFEASGLYRDSNGTWNFIQKGVFFDNGKAYNLVARMLTGSVDELKPIMEKIIASFRM